MSRNVVNLFLSFVLMLGVMAGESAFPSAANAETLEIYVPSAPGGSRDIYARVMARYMPKYLPGHPNTIVKNMPGAGGDIMLNYLYFRAKRDGSVIATATNAMLRAERIGQTSARYDIRKFNYIGAMPESPYMLVIRADHPVKHFKELFTTKKPVFYGMEIGGGSTELIGFLLRERLKANIKFVSGYRGSARRVGAVLRGELDMTLDRLSTQEEHLREGKTRPIIILTYKEHIPADLRGDAPEWFELDLDPKLREISDFIITPTDLDKTYVAPPGVPKERIAVLRKAFDETLADPKLSAFLKKRGAVSPAVKGEDLEKKIVPRLLAVSKETADTVKKWMGR